MKPSILQRKAEVFLNDEVYPIVKKFPLAEKFCLCQEIKQACYSVIRRSMQMSGNKTDRRIQLNKIDDDLKHLLVLFNLANGQRYLTDKKTYYLQCKIKELGRITGGLLKSV